jgi:hypothetical protein
MTPEQIQTLSKLRDDLALLCDDINRAHDVMGQECAAGSGPMPSQACVQELRDLEGICGDIAALIARARRNKV